MNLLTVLSQHSRQITKPGSTQDLKSGPSDLRAVDPTPNEHQTPSAWQRCGAQPKPPPRTFGRTTREQSSTKCRARRDLAPSVPVVWGRMPPPVLTQYRPQGVVCKQATARSCAPPGARTPETGVRRPRSRDRAEGGEPPTGQVPEPPHRLTASGGGPHSLRPQRHPDPAGWRSTWTCHPPSSGTALSRLRWLPRGTVERSPTPTCPTA